MKKALIIISIIFLFRGLSFSQDNYLEHVIDQNILKSYTISDADLNKDGLQDIIVSRTNRNLVLSSSSQTHYESKQISWAKNLGNGRFDFIEHFANVVGTNCVIFDVDEDGLNDIVATLWEENKLVWYKNIGDSKFTHPIILDNLLDKPFSLALIDLNNDGRKEILCGTINSFYNSTVLDKLIVYSISNFGATIGKKIAAESRKIFKIQEADFNSDEFKDVLIQHDSPFSGSKVFTYLNDGNMNLTSYSTFDITADVQEVLVSKINNDNLDDVFFLTSSQKIKRFVNNGSGFSSLGIDVATNGKKFTNRDIDTDGDDDLLSITDYQIDLYRNDNGGYTMSTQFLFSPYVSSGYFGAASFHAFDANNDGNVDLFYANSETFQLALNGGNMSFSDTRSLQSLMENNHTIVIDFDKDGDADILTYLTGIDTWKEEGVGWYENMGNNEFDKFEILVQTNEVNLSHFQVCDYNTDGFNDLLYTGYDSFGTEMTIHYENNSNANLGVDVDATYLVNDEANPVLIDVESDGDMDYLTFFDGYLYLRKNNGDGTFGVMTEVRDNQLNRIPTIDLIASLCKVLDFDLDGKLDIVYGNLWLKNLGQSKFSQANIIVTDALIPFNYFDKKFDYQDVDTDGDVDFITTYITNNSPSNNALIVFYNNGNMGFSTSDILIDGIEEVATFAIADLNTDNLNDILVSYKNKISVFYGGSNYPLVQENIIQTYFSSNSFDVNAAGFFLADISGDNSMDFVVQNFTENKISWFENKQYTCQSKIYFQNQAICINESFVFGNKILEEPGLYIDTFVSKNFCDSIVYLTLSISDTPCEMNKCSELFISEYIESSGLSKAIELYNPTRDTISLAGYALHVFHETSNVDSVIVFNGIIYPDSTFVIAHPSSTTSILNLADQLSGGLDFDGNDALALSKNRVIIDVVGRINTPFSTESSGFLLANSSLVRMNSVQSGSFPPNYYFLSEQFISSGTDNFSNLKIHTSDCQQFLCSEKVKLDYLLCQGDTLTFGNKNYSSSGVFFDSLLTTSNCDSIIERRIVVNNSFHTFSEVVCANEGFNFNNTVLTSSGIYYDTLANVNLCDSIVRLELTVLPNLSNVITVAACDSYTSPSGNYSWTSSNIYFDTIANSGGCDSIITINLTIGDAIDPVADITNLADVTATCMVTSLTAPTATDNCAGSIVGTHNVSLPITSQGITTITWTYDDGNGNTSIQTQNVVINDVIAPVANAVSLLTINSACQVTSLTAPTATDNCEGLIVGTHNLVLPVVLQGTTVVTWTYTDGNGNTSTQTQNIIISDDFAPQADLLTLSIINSVCPVTNLTAPTATDNCIGSVIGTHNVTLPITMQGTTVITWTYEDGNGNTSTQTQNVVIEDISAPIPTVPSLPTITSECSLTNLSAPTAIDNCAGSIMGTHNTPLPITALGTTTVTWVYEDGNGNSSSQTQNIVILDVSSPVANELNLVDVTSECAVLSLNAPTATDNCIGLIFGTHDAILPISANGTTTVTWVYDDGHGNTSSQIQNVVITPIDNEITQIGDVSLSANSSGYSYQWLDCDSGYQYVSGENNQTFVASVNGNYAVEIDNGTCKVTSDCIMINQVGIVETMNNEIVRVYPNPTNRDVIISSESTFTKVEIVNLLGQKVAEYEIPASLTYSVDLQEKIGLYIIKIYFNDSTLIRSIVKN